MRALTLRQPYASFVVGLDIYGSPIKMIETRPWSTGYRGPLAIHSSTAGPDIQLLEKIALGLPISRESILRLPRGKIIGKVTLVDCLPVEKLYGSSLDTERERRLSDWGAGRFAFVFANPVEFVHPITVKGSSRIWDWNSPKEEIEVARRK